MSKIKDLTGQTFGKLTAVSLLPTRSKDGKALWRCRCSCGNWAPAVVGNNLTRPTGGTKSCGCERREAASKLGAAGRTHGLAHKSGNAHYQRWASIKQRTGNPKLANYKHYGGRGIKMYPAWFNSFIFFKAWLDENLGPCPEGYSLDRIDNDGNYEPDNLRWASAKQQTNNRR